MKTKAASKENPSRRRSFAVKDRERRQEREREKLIQERERETKEGATKRENEK